jgi:class 3 adenylate cyclase
MEPRIQYVRTSDVRRVYEVTARLGTLVRYDQVRSLARTSAGVRFEDRGEQALKGVGEPVRVWAIVDSERED